MAYRRTSHLARPMMTADAPAAPTSVPEPRHDCYSFRECCGRRCRFQPYDCVDTIKRVNASSLVGPLMPCSHRPPNVRQGCALCIVPVVSGVNWTIALNVFRLQIFGRRQQGRIFSKRGPCSEKMWGPLIYEWPVTAPPPHDCLHATLSGPTRTIVIIDILLTTRVAIFCPFVGPPFCGGPCSAEHAEHA